MTCGNPEIIQQISQLARQRLSRYFTKARRRSGYKVETVEALTGVDVQSMEDGTSSFPLDEIEALTRFYGIPPLQFMDWLTRLDLDIQKIRNKA
jgi:hypothetical protein